MKSVLNSIKLNVHENHRFRLKKRAISHGIASLEDHEILESILFFPIKRSNTNELSHHLINKFGSLENVLSTDTADLEKFGLSTTTAVWLSNFSEICRICTKEQLIKTKISQIVGNLEQEINENEDFFKQFNMLIVGISSTGDMIYKKLIPYDVTNIKDTTKDICVFLKKYYAKYALVVYTQPEDSFFYKNLINTYLRVLSNSFSMLSVTVVGHYSLSNGKLVKIGNNPK